MNADALIRRLESFADALPAVVTSMDAADARWKPPSGAWSVLEIVNHLADEEVEDFRQRLELTLRDPARRWPSIDPETAAVERRYNERDLNESVRRFVSERRKSIEWLHGLKEPDWHATHEHKKLGPVMAGAILASWAAHDDLHLRQIAKRLYELNNRDGQPYGTEYAGEWGA